MKELESKRASARECARQGCLQRQGLPSRMRLPPERGRGRFMKTGGMHFPHLAPLPRALQQGETEGLEGTLRKRVDISQETCPCLAGVRHTKFKADYIPWNRLIRLF